MFPTRGQVWRATFLALLAGPLVSCSAAQPPPAATAEAQSHPRVDEPPPSEAPEVVAVLADENTVVQPPPATTADARDVVLPDAPPDARALREPPSESHRLLDELGSDIDAGRLAPSRARLTNLLAGLATGGTPDEVMTARALLGRAHERGGSRLLASREYAQVLAVWEADKNLAKVRASGAPRDLARLAHALSAVGEALFFEGETLRKRAEALTLPRRPPSRYRAPAKRVEDMTADEFQREMDRQREETTALKRYIDGAVKSWVESKRARIGEAEAAYARIAQLQPAPPPVWVIAGAAQVGELWSDFADDFNRVPMPKWMENDPQLAPAYREALEGSISPIRQRAQAAFSLCKRTAETYRVNSDDAKACERWLTANDPSAGSPP